MEGGQHEAHGKSGEHGSLQYLPSTWVLWSTEVAGRELPFNEVNEFYVAYKMVETWMDEGYSDKQIALMWNQGHPGQCKSGINSKGVRYDSCAYARMVLAKM